MSRLECQYNMIELFNKCIDLDHATHELNPKALKELILHGIVVDLDFLRQLDEHRQLDFAKYVSYLYGLSQEENQSTLYKKFSTVKDASDLELLVTQLLHYASTYGTMMLENDQLKDYIYEPEEIDEEQYIENLRADFKNTFKHIELVSLDEAKDMIKEFVSKSQPLSQNDKNAIFNLVFDLLSYEEISKLDINNKELMCEMYIKINQIMEERGQRFILPQNPHEFLRLIVRIASHSTLLIKSEDMISLIECTMKHSNSADRNKIELYFNAYIQSYGYIGLAEIFNRYKPIFLSFKNDQTKSIINKISRLSKMYHKPMKVDVLSHAVDLVDKEKIDVKDLINEIEYKLENDFISMYQVVKLFNAFSLRGEELYQILKHKNYKIVGHQTMQIDDTIHRVYKIRNGQTYIKSQPIDKTYTLNELSFKLEQIMLIKSKLLNLITKYIENKFHNKVIRVDDLYQKIDYKMPTSTKNFIGHIPEFTSLTLKGNTSLGVIWRQHADLDLSCYDSTQDQYVSWHGLSRTRDRKILYSGDMTDLNIYGVASETIFVDKDLKSNLTFDFSLYYSSHSSQIDYQLAFNEDVDIDQYADISKMKMILPMTTSKKQYGSYLATSHYNEYDDTRTYVINSTATGKRVVNGHNLSEKAHAAIKLKSNAYLSLNKVINKADVLIARNDEEYEDLINWNKDLETVDLRSTHISKNDILKFI